MEKHLLSKSTFIRGSQCLKSLYLHNKRPFLRDKLSPEQLAKFRRGTKIGIIAQQLFPGGINLKPGNYRQYAKKLEQTQELVNSGENNVLYEAGFQYDRLLVFIDVLVKENGQRTAYEVKSSIKVSKTFLLDAAFQYYVITNSGTPLNDFFIVYINKDFSNTGNISLEDLFIKQSVLKEVLELQDYVKDLVEKEKEILDYKKSPEIEPGPHCTSPYPCDFIGHCWKKVQEEKRPQINYSSEDFYDFVDEMLNKLQNK